jgi:hypothetical protein
MDKSTREVFGDLEKIDGFVIGIPDVKLVELVGNLNKEMVQFNLQSLEYLMEKGYVEIADLRYEVLRAHADQIKDVLPVFESGDSFGELIATLEGQKRSLVEGSDLAARVLGITKSSVNNEVFPLLQDVPVIRDGGKKAELLDVILSKIPEPEDTVEWSQLFEFKSDPNTKRSYMALIDWVNEMSRKDYTKNEINEKFEYLYQQLESQYEIHKIKKKYTFLEIILNTPFKEYSMATLLSLILPAIRLRKISVQLLEEEMKFTGRELAYIYKAKQNFTDSK